MFFGLVRNGVSASKSSERNLHANIESRYFPVVAKRNFCHTRNLVWVVNDLWSLNIPYCIWLHQLVCDKRERERFQCFSQPTSLITYRRRQMSDLEEIKATQNKLENLQSREETEEEELHL